jgi:hypothetical protein
MPTAPTPEVDVDDELMEAANVPGDQEAVDEDAPFDDDVDELLLGSTSRSAPAPQKIKIKPVRRPAPDLDDLDADLYDAADASGPSQTTKKEPFEPQPPRKLKVSLSRPKEPSVPIATPQVTRTPERRPTPTLAAPVKSEEPTPALPSIPDLASTSRKRAANAGEMEDGSSVPIDAVKCKALIQKLSDVQYGWIFAVPVDSTQPGLESYEFSLFVKQFASNRIVLDTMRRLSSLWTIRQ